MIQVRFEMCYFAFACYSYFYGNYSEPIFASTNATSEEFYIRNTIVFIYSIQYILWLALPQYILYLGRHLIISLLTSPKHVLFLAMMTTL